MIDTGYLKYCISIDPLPLKIIPGWWRYFKVRRKNLFTNLYSIFYLEVPQ